MLIDGDVPLEQVADPNNCETSLYLDGEIHVMLTAKQKLKVITHMLRPMEIVQQAESVPLPPCMKGHEGF